MKQDEMILKAAKEIAVKFIEVGTINPSTFNSHFRNIYTTVEKAVRENARQQESGEKQG
ncbi:MAG: hypothetical protein K9J85_05525 [Desulfobacteraceae bacterium]|nr:hypothetical protein [Desulfobacteraceae bacterium]